MQINGRRFDGTSIPITAIGVCNVQGCGQIAYKENCNAEGDECRMHWHGTLHTKSSYFGSGMLCPKHAEECRQEWCAKHKDVHDDLVCRVPCLGPAGILGLIRGLRVGLKE